MTLILGFSSVGDNEEFDEVAEEVGMLIEVFFSALLTAGFLTLYQKINDIFS